MAKGTDTSKLVGRGDNEQAAETLPTPSMQFRRLAWMKFQRALDPLAVPKPLPMKRRH